MASERPMSPSAATATFWLLVACAIWGMSFNWNKLGQAALQELVAPTELQATAGTPRKVEPAILTPALSLGGRGGQKSTLTPALSLEGRGSQTAAPPVGPVLFLAIRFVAATALWALLIPASRRGWTRGTVRYGVVAGLLFAGGLLLQHYSFYFIDESLSAFLTSLTIVFTPLLAALLLRHRIGASLWFDVALAGGGAVLMAGASGRPLLGAGIVLGVAAPIVYAAHIIAIDHYGKRENPWRFTLAQFIVATIVFVAAAALWPGSTADGPVGRASLPAAASTEARPTEFRPAEAHRPEARPAVGELRRPAPGPGIAARINPLGGGDPRLLRDFWLYLGLTTVGVTIVAFGIMFRYQPCLSPTRAAILYATEPLFASAYVWFVADARFATLTMVGAALILAANLHAMRPGAGERVVVAELT